MLRQASKGATQALQRRNRGISQAWTALSGLTDEVRAFTELAHGIQELLRRNAAGIPTLSTMHWIQGLRMLAAHQAGARVHMSVASLSAMAATHAPELALFRKYAPLATAIYEPSEAKFFEKALDHASLANHPGFCPIMSRFSPEANRPVFMMCQDMQTQEVVLAVRGTYSLHDLITDISCDAAPFMWSFAHRGIADSARDVHAAVIDKLHSLQAGRREPLNLRVVGHSLGGGVAALLTLILRYSGNIRARAVAFAPPPCLAPDISSACTEVVQSLVFGDDLIPRCSELAALRLLEDISRFSKSAGNLQSAPLAPPEVNQGLGQATMGDLDHAAGRDGGDFETLRRALASKSLQQFLAAKENSHRQLLETTDTRVLQQQHLILDKLNMFMGQIPQLLDASRSESVSLVERIKLLSFEIQTLDRANKQQSELASSNAAVMAQLAELHEQRLFADDINGFGSDLSDVDASATSSILDPALAPDSPQPHDYQADNSQFSQQSQHGGFPLSPQTTSLACRTEFPLVTISDTPPPSSLMVLSSVDAATGPNAVEQNDQQAQWRRFLEKVRAQRAIQSGIEEHIARVKSDLQRKYSIVLDESANPAPPPPPSLSTSKDSWSRIWDLAGDYFGSLELDNDYTTFDMEARQLMHRGGDGSPAKGNPSSDAHAVKKTRSLFSPENDENAAAELGNVRHMPHFSSSQDEDVIDTVMSTPSSPSLSSSSAPDAPPTARIESELVIPATAFYLVRTNPSSSSAPDEQLYLTKSSPEAFNAIHLSQNMLGDHWMTSYIIALEAAHAQKQSRRQDSESEKELHREAS